MKAIRSRAALALQLAAVAQSVSYGIALGHTSGADATPEHVLLEVAEWGLAAAIALGLIVLIFWVRAKRRPE